MQSRHGFHSSYKAGFSVVELAVAAAIIISLVTVAIGAWQMYFRLTYTNSALTQASLLTEETSDALHLLRDASWSSNINGLTLNRPYFLVWNASTTAYSLSTGTTTMTSGLASMVSFAPISRDVNQNIVASGGSNDAHTRTVTITIINASSSAAYMTSYILLHDVFKN